MNKKDILPIGLIFIVIISRIIPHIPNWTPVESIALFSGAYILRNKLAYLIPILGIYLGDLILNNTIYRTFYPSEEGMIWISGYMIWTFLAMGGIIFLGSRLKTNLKPIKIIGFSFLGSVLFFVLSNFGVWLGSVIYAKSFLGLIECYTLALPFFKNSLISNLVFTMVLFGSMEYLLKPWFMKTQQA